MIILGSIIAEETPDQPIYFTSDAPDPQNGDWSMVRLESPGVSRFSYCVFECGQQGLNVWNGSPEIDHCVFRWNNWEGVYFESFCEPLLTYCQIYENGYNGLAAEQSNRIIMDYCEVWRNGTNGIHIDNSFGEIRRSRVHSNGASGISVDDGGTLRVVGVASYDNGACGIGVGEGDNTVEVGHVDISSNEGYICGSYTRVDSVYTPPDTIDFGVQTDETYALNYIPGDSHDTYLYVYPDDETRRIVRKIGEGLGLTWSLGWDGQYIWTCTLWNHVYKLDPSTGEILDQFELAESEWGTPSQPWGMTFDDEGFMWIVDFAERKLFKIDVVTREAVYSFDSPSPREGGCKGLAWDGTYLCVMGWVEPAIYRMTKTGDLVHTVRLQGGGSGGLAWDGEAFWVPGGRGIMRYNTQGDVIGWIYAASEGTWDLEWDGTYLWAAQRTNENWPDAKIYQVEILDDHSNMKGKKGKAVLSLQSHPDAAVFINSIYRGETPLTIELEEGMYIITMEREAYEPYIVIVDLSAGEEKDVTATLEPEKVLEKALLSIDSHPDGAVFINSIYRGETPLTIELEEGEYELKIQKEGYNTYNEIIKIPPGEKKNISVMLSRLSRLSKYYYVLGLIVIGLSGAVYLIKRSQ